MLMTAFTSQIFDKMLVSYINSISFPLWMIWCELIDIYVYHLERTRNVREQFKNRQNTVEPKK